MLLEVETCRWPCPEYIDLPDSLLNLIRTATITECSSVIYPD
jgi:hypothetical protein